MLLADGYCWLVIGWWLCGFAIRGLAEPRIQSESHVKDLCSDARCSCSPISVTCHCSPQDQEATLSVGADSMPRDATLLIIDGCRDVILAGGAIHHMEGLQRIDIVDVGRVLFQKDAFNQAQVKRKTTVNIGRCRHLVLESRSVTGNSREPVTFSASDCHVVDVGATAFSATQRISLTDVEQLQLASLAFRQTPPISTNITIQNARVKDIKAFTFPSPLEQLRMLNVSVGRVESNATSAVRISHLSINGSRIGIVAPGAFSQLTLFDSFQIQHTSIQQLEGKALASATSLLVMEDCMVGEMSTGAVSMPAAGVKMRRNRIGTLGSGALDLREWNDVLIENNTFGLVERQAFYNIAEPRLKDDEVRLVLRRNDVMEARPGAFIFSAQALKVRLIDNRFGKACDCNLVEWTADLTQVKRHAHNHPPAEENGGSEEVPVSEALWLGSSLFHSSSCRIDSATAQCASVIPEGHYLFMVNYTSEFCVRPEVMQCVATLRRNNDHSVLNQSSLVNDSGYRYGIASIGLNSIQDVILVSIMAVLASAFLLAVLLGLFYARRRTKSRRADASGGKKTASGDEDRCTPLMTDSLGSGVVSSGSISRLSVRDYNDYLAELGPIYSEPLDPPIRPAEIPTESKTPPELPARSVPDTGSLASEFTQEILAALRMEVSPTYSQVMDSLPVETSKPKPKMEEERELYDQIRVMLPASGGSEHIYCKPWTEAPDYSGPLFLPSSGQSEDGGSALFPPALPISATGSTLPQDVIHPLSDPAADPASVPAPKIRSTLPKWPPPAKKMGPEVRNGSQTKSPTLSKLLTERPPSPGPPKPARVGSPAPNVCDYADPRDVTDDHFYSELNAAPQYATVMNN